MTSRAKSGHVASSMSMADILAVLYEKILHIDPARPDWADRDRFILSKGHAGAGVYAVLAEKGFFPKEWLDTYYLDGGHLSGHISHCVPGVEFSSGSLGHGLPVSCGIALAGKRDGKNYRVFTLLSDGECDEGSNWEAALFAPQHKLDNLTVIIDYNKIQALGPVQDIINLEPLAKKWQDFGWAVCEIDGHNYDEIEKALLSVPFEPGKPSCIVANTIKGKGVSFMENKVAWHYDCANPDQLCQALKELEE